jgi:hypothetical protein
VDNTIGTAYADAIRPQLPPRTTLVHAEWPARMEGDERIANAREIIRETVLAGGYDAWWSIESDVFVPRIALERLVPFLDQFHCVHHSYPLRQPEFAHLLAGGFGCSLIRREALAQFGFRKQFGDGVDPLTPNCWHGGEAWFNYRVLRHGWATCDLHNVVPGIRHV